MKKNLLVFFVSVSACFAQNLRAQNAGDYMSVASGNWSDVSTWNVFDGLSWIPAVLPPSSLNGVITVQDSVTVSINDSADQLIVKPAGVLNILPGITLKLLNGTGTDLQCDGRLIIGVGAALADNDADVSSVNYTSASVLEIDGALNPSITFNGTSSQTVNGLSGSGYFGRQITLDNTNNLTVTGTVGFGGVNFVNGKIWAPGYFVIGQFSGSNFTGQNSTNFIDGNVACIVYDKTPATFSLPMGKDNSYLPLVFNITLAVAQESGFVVSIKNGAPPALALPSSIANVSSVRYYNISNTSNVAINSASIQLSYDSTDRVTDPSHLRIVKNNKDSAWVNLGGAGTTIPRGIISSTHGIKNLGEFALANATGGTNTLPLLITSFTASIVKQSVLLNWTTQAELNTDHFNVERQEQSSANWQTVGTVAANKGASANSYSFIDASVKNTGSYLYRLNEIDKDGVGYLSKTVLVRMDGGTGRMDVTGMYPNPARDVVHYYVTAPANDAITVTLSSANGKIVKLQKATANQSFQVGINDLSSGTYYLTFTNERTGEKVMRKLVKM